PISLSLQKAYGKNVDQTRVTEVKEISGYGVEAVIDGSVHVAVGNDRLMRRTGVEPVACHHIGTVIHVAVDGQYAGHILITDELKEHSREAMAELKKAGVEKEVMLTGDIEKVASSVAEEV
ncbi:MAG TPA: heavy metal translocating P-type ATPase, partial [Lachnospiraceae bacterium]|nr:heavy metal translocating P-type ATPase [Lachnospiraceae bacterium]